MKKKLELNEIQIDRVIEMAWEDRTPFDAILMQFGLKEQEVITLMRTEMKASSFKMWRARVQGRKTKHSKSRSETVDRFKCTRQRNINNNKVSSVKTNHGELTADSYSVSLGSHSPKILSSVGIDIPVYPVKGYSITLPVLNDLDAPQSTIMDDKNKVGITRLGNTIRVAGIAHLTDHNSSLREKSLHSLKKGLNNLFPHAAKETNDINFWTGFRPSTPDSTPIIGATPYSNLYLNTGHGTLGWTMSLGSGKLLANIVSGNEPEISLEGIDMSRYKYSNKTNLNYG